MRRRTCLASSVRHCFRYGSPLLLEFASWPLLELDSFTSEFHFYKTPYNQSHLQGFEWTGNDFDFILSDGRKNGFKILFRIDQRICRSQLRQEMSIRIADERTSIKFGNFKSLLIKVDQGRIKMTIFQGIKNGQMV